MIIIDILEYYYTQHGPVSSRYRYCNTACKRSERCAEPLVVSGLSVCEESSSDTRQGQRYPGVVDRIRRAESIRAYTPQACSMHPPTSSAQPPGELYFHSLRRRLRNSKGLVLVYPTVPTNRNYSHHSPDSPEAAAQTCRKAGALSGSHLGLTPCRQRRRSPEITPRSLRML